MAVGGRVADLFARLLLDDQGFEAAVVKTGTKAGAKAGTKMSQSMGGSLKKGIAQGLGLGAGLGVIGLATTAISGLTSVIGDSIQAAIDDEESQNRLRASLKANVPSWNGYTQAIEKNITARQRLGFDDEQQRDALTVLAGATHDVAEAERVMGIAMDFARFKGIDLHTAAEALIKVEAGQYRALKGLGIQLRTGATQQEALAAVQKVTAGQAEAYAETLKGKLLANQIRVSEAMEDFGRVALPLVADGLDAVIAKTDTLAKGFDVLTGKQDLGTQSAYDLARATAGQLPFMDKVIDLSEGITNAIRGTTGATSELATVDRSAWGSGLRVAAAAPSATRALLDLTHGVEDNAVAFKDWSARIIESSGEVAHRLADDARTIVDDVFGPIMDRDALAAQSAEANAARRVLASKTASAAEKRDARATLHQVQRDREETLINLAEAGELSAEKIKTHLATLQRRYDKATGNSRKAIGRLIDKWKELARLQAKPVTLSVIEQLLIVKKSKASGHEIRDSGGAVSKDTPYWVGVNRRRELFVPETDGQIMTMPQLQGLASAMSKGGGGDTNTTNINVGRADQSTVHDIVWEQRRLAATRTMLPRRYR